MSDRVYVLLKVVEGKSAQVVSTLKDKHGVVMADVLEDQSEVMMVAEASERQRLAELTVQAIISVEDVTGEVRLLPIKREDQKATGAKCSNTYRRTQRVQGKN